MLPRNNFVEVNSLELKGKYVGQTAPTVKKAVADAMGGTLFIDEAPALVENGGGDHYSGEAVRTLLTEVENNRSKLMVVLAGYEAKMEILMAADDGLPRRFQRRLHIEDYTPAELAQICVKYAREKFQLTITPDVEEAVAGHIATAYGPQGSVSANRMKRENAGLAINLVERAFKELAARTQDQGVSRNSPELSILRPADFGIGPRDADDDSAVTTSRGRRSLTDDNDSASVVPSPEEGVVTDAVQISRKLAADARDEVIDFLQEIPPNLLLRLLKRVTEPESRGKKGPEPPPEAPPPAPPKHEISYIQAPKEAPKKKKKRASTEEPKEEPEEAEQPKPKEEDEEDVEEAMLERLRNIGVEGSARLAWPVPAAAASLFHSMPAGLPDGVPVVRCHQP